MADFDARFAGLRERFVAQLAAEARAIADGAGAGRWIAVRDVCHGLAGRAGMFGFHTLGDAAREVEEAIVNGARAQTLAPLVARLLAEMDDAQAA